VLWKEREIMCSILKSGIMENKRKQKAGGERHVSFMPRRGGCNAYFITVYRKG